jgi:hypothetical protein
MYRSTLSLTSALEGSGLSTPRPARFTPGKDPVPTVQVAGWASGPVWTTAENLASTGIRSPERPVATPAHKLRSYVPKFTSSNSLKLQRDTIFWGGRGVIGVNVLVLKGLVILLYQFTSKPE